MYTFIDLNILSNILNEKHKILYKLLKYLRSGILLNFPIIFNKSYSI